MARCFVASESLFFIIPDQTSGIIKMEMQQTAHTCFVYKIGGVVIILLFRRGLKGKVIERNVLYGINELMR